MEEDIKGAIERLSKAQNDIWYATLYSQEEQDEDIKILLKGYKVEKLRNTLDEQSLKEALENYIPKSKIKEKIEELKKAYEIALEENSTKAFILKCQIDILEKLMEDK